MSFTAIGDTLFQKYGQTKLAEQTRAALVCEYANELISRLWSGAMENIARAVYLKDKGLFIACLASPAAADLKLREGEIVRALNERFGQGVVDSIVILL